MKYEEIKNMDFLKNNKKGLIFIVVIILLITIPVSCNKKKKENFIDKVYDAYYDNAYNAKEKYDNKKVTFIGQVSSVESDLSSITVVPVDDEIISLISLRVAFCYLSDNKLQEKAKKLKSGDVVEIEGTLSMYDDSQCLIFIDVTKIK